jgi:RNA polymerase sigma-70 factor (ECF subfamily)
MQVERANQRLSQITTQWSIVLQAHLGEADAVASAQRELMQRYGGAVHRYLLAALRDHDAADEVAQEFALRFLRGAFRRADPQRGRFRDFVKTAVLNLITDYYRRRKARPVTVPADADLLVAPKQEPEDFERQFVDSWRGELLDRAWEALRRFQEQTGRPVYTVLRLRADQPDLRSAQMAEQLIQLLNKPVTDVWVRQVLRRARQRFAYLLCEEVMHSLPSPSRDELERELVDLGLLEYCRPILEQHEHPTRGE